MTARGITSYHEVSRGITRYHAAFRDGPRYDAASSNQLSGALVVQPLKLRVHRQAVHRHALSLFCTVHIYIRAVVVLLSGSNLEFEKPANMS